MIAINFPEANLMLAEDQPEYQTLPVYVEIQSVIIPNRPQDPQLAIVTQDVPWSMTACFQLEKEEIEQIVATGQIWYRQMLYGGKFQPIDMSVINPFINQPNKDENI